MFFHKKIYQDLKKISKNGMIIEHSYEDEKSDYIFWVSPDTRNRIEDSIKILSNNPNFGDFRCKGISIDLDRYISVIELRYCDRYLAIKNKLTRTIKISDYDGEYQINYFIGNEMGGLLVHPDGDIKSFSGQGNYYPATVKTLFKLKMPDEINEVILKSYAKDSKFYKDLMSDRFYPALPLMDLPQYHTKLQYMTEKFPDVTFPKSVNKKSLSCLFGIGCAWQYVQQEQCRLMFESAYTPPLFNMDNVSCRPRDTKQTAETYSIKILQMRNNVDLDVESDLDFYDVLVDYVRMSITLKKPIDLMAGRKQIKELHNILVDESLKNKYRRDKLRIKKGPLYFLKLPKEFVNLSSVSMLAAEAEIQHNCVLYYQSYIEAGKSKIYSADINGEHVTIEIVASGTGKNLHYRLTQCRKAYNKQCNTDTWEYILNAINGAADQAINAYNKYKTRNP